MFNELADDVEISENLEIVLIDEIADFFAIFEFADNPENVKIIEIPRLPKLL